MPKYISIAVLVFFITFITTLVLTVLVAYVWDGETPLPPHAGAKALPPFPLVVPLAVAPPTSPTTDTCVNLVGAANGGYVPSPLNPLRPCSSDTDCEGCHITPSELNHQTLSCVSGSTYPNVPAQQTALNNRSAKFCLPKRHACLPPRRDDLLACTHDADCASCDDEIGNGAAMQCQIVSRPKVIGFDDMSEVFAVEPGKWCLPRTGECDAENGVLQWTTGGWACNCRYPNIHGGESCNVMKACNNFLTTPWSREQQQLLLNEETSDPEVWKMDTGVNPVLCHNIEESDRSKWDLVCNAANTNLVPNTVCQCDGLMLGSHTGFRNEAENPLTCTVDSCSVNALGGRAVEPLSLNLWSTTQPPNQCVCSGANSRIWDSDSRNPDIVQATDPALAELLRAQEGYIFRGRCNDVVLPNSQVTLLAKNERKDSAICEDGSNDVAEVSSLVPGFAQNAAGDATVNVCSADPCRGMYSDPSFSPTKEFTNWGHYGATAGECLCAPPSVRVPLVGECENTLNPVCSTCVNACVGMDSNDPDDWPCRQHPKNPCPQKPQCITDTNGKAQCMCPVGCGNTDGVTCAAQFDHNAGCKGYVGVPNICKPEVVGGYSACKCHEGRRPKDGGGAWSITTKCVDTDRFYAKCTGTTSTKPTCREGSAGMFVTCAGSACPDETGCERVDVG